MPAHFLIMEAWMVFVGWSDKLSVYRGGPVDDNGDPTGPPLPVDGMQDRDCRLKSTDNYDEVSSPAGRVKVNNIDTSDEVRTTVDIDLRADDKVKIVRGRSGLVKWFAIAGAPKVRDRLNYQSAFMNEIKDPTL